MLVNTGVQGSEGGALSLWETLVPLGLQGSQGLQQQHPGQRAAFTRVPEKAGPCLHHSPDFHVFHIILGTLSLGF